MLRVIATWSQLPSGSWNVKDKAPSENTQSSLLVLKLRHRGPERHGHTVTVQSMSPCDLTAPNLAKVHVAPIVSSSRLGAPTVLQGPPSQLWPFSHSPNPVQIQRLWIYINYQSIDWSASQPICSSAQPHVWPMFRAQDHGLTSPSSSSCSSESEAKWRSTDETPRSYDSPLATDGRHDIGNGTVGAVTSEG